MTRKIYSRGRRVAVPCCIRSFSIQKLDVLGQRDQELSVVLGLRKASEHELRALRAAEHRNHSTHRVDLSQRVLVQQQVLAARAGALDVDRGEDATLGQLTVEVQLHVAG